MITITEKGLQQAIQVTAGIPLKLNRHVQQVFQATGAESLEVMNRLTPYRTGYLRSRNKVTYRLGPEEIDMVASNDAPYAVFVCFGTRYMRAQDFMTPAMVYGRNKLNERLPPMKL